MYQFTQKHNKLILIVVCVVLLPFVGFSFYPIMSRISGNQALHEAVGTFEVPVGKVHAVQVDEWRATSKRLSRVGKVMRIQAQNADDIWLHLTQVAEAELLGVEIGDDYLAEFVTNLRENIGAQKLERYRTFVREQVGLSLKEFERTLREILMRDELRRLYYTTDNVAWDDLLKKYQQENRKVTVRAVKFDVDEIRKGLKPIDFPMKPRLEEYYNNPNKRFFLEGRQELMLPRVFEEVKVVFGAYDTFNPDLPAVKELLKGYQPTDLEINQEYERWKHALYRNKTEPATKTETPGTPGAKTPGAGDSSPEVAPGSQKGGQDSPPKNAPQDKPGEAKPEAKPAPPPFKPLAEVRNNVVKRFLLRKTVTLVRAEAERLINAARAEATARKAEEKKARDAARKDKTTDKAAGEAAAPGQKPVDSGNDANKDRPENTAEETTQPGQKPAEADRTTPEESVPTVDLDGLARKYGLEYRKIGPETVETIKKCKPFDEDIPRRLPVLVMELTEGKLSRVVDDTRKLVYFARLIKDRPEQLKPLADIQDEVREVVMDEAARDKARDEAQAFFDGLREKIMEELKPVLDKEVREPLRKRKEEEIARENRERQDQGRPPLSAEELKVIDQRFEELRNKDEAPRVDKALEEKRGQFFDLLASEKKLKPEDFSFFVLTSAFRRRGPDANVDMAEKETKPDLWFLKNRAGISSLQKVGDVSPPQMDGDRAFFVLKLVNTESPEWKRLDPKTFEGLMNDQQRGLMYREQSGAGRLGALQLDRRFDLKTQVRYQPEQDQGQPTPILPNQPAPPSVPPAR